MSAKRKRLVVAALLSVLIAIAAVLILSSEGDDSGELLYFDRVLMQVVTANGGSGNPSGMRPLSSRNAIAGPQPPDSTAYSVRGDGSILVTSSYALPSGANPVARMVSRMRPGYFSRLLEPGQAGCFDQVWMELATPGAGVPPVPNPIPNDQFVLESALLPICDVRMLDVLELAFRGGSPNTIKAAVLAREVLDAHPGDPLAVLLAIDACVMDNDAPGAEALLASHGRVLDESPAPYYQRAGQYYRGWLEAMEATGEGRNLYNGTEKKWRDTFLRIEQGSLLNPIYFHDRPLILPGKTTGPVLPPGIAPNLLGNQVLAKVQRTRATFELLSGDTASAARVMGGVHVMGTSMMDSGLTVIERLVGCAIAAIATRGEELVYLDGCRTPEEIAELWPNLDSGYKNQRRALEDPLWHVHIGGAGVDFAMTPANRKEIDRRYKAALAGTAALHTAAAARHCLLRTGSLPQDAGDWAPLLPDGPDDDPFSQAKLLTLAAGDDLLVYSVGPDSTDDKGARDYDPSNGTFSSGDIVVRVARARRYPFPIATDATRDAIFAQFPAGLPADTFADVRGIGLAVNDEAPPLIWSVGPDTDSERLRVSLAEKDVPVSGGKSPDAWKLAPEAKLENPIPPGVAIGWDHQQLHFYVNLPNQPTYDPTNGTTSAGNLTWRVGTKPLMPSGS